MSLSIAALRSRTSAGGRAVSVAVLGLMGLLGNSGTWASGFQLQEQSASGLGVAYSGMPAAVQDGSSAFWNPAGLSLLPGSGATVAVQYVIPGITFRSAGGPPSGSTYAAFGDGGDAGVSSWIPAMYGYSTLADKLSVGLVVNAPFGLSTNWQGQWAGMFRAVKSRVETLNINPVVSYQINEFLSVGAGVSYERLKASLTRAVTPLVPGAQGRLDGDDWSWGWNLGLMLDLRQGTRVGVTYRSNIDYDISGTLAFNSPALAPLGGGAHTSLRLPRTAALGLSHQLTAALRLLADYSWTGWNSISALSVVATSGASIGQVVLSDALNFRNSWRAGIGAEYQLSQPLLLRAGFAYDRSPVQDAFRTPRLPDNDRKWFAVGARYACANGCSVDFGYAYLLIQDTPSRLATTGLVPVPGALIGTYKLHTHVLGVQVAAHF